MEPTGTNHPCGLAAIISLKIPKNTPIHLFLKYLISSGAYTGGETPVPIPNTVVKPSRADGTRELPPWESRSVPGDFFIAKFIKLVIFNSSI